MHNTNISGDTRNKMNILYLFIYFSYSPKFSLSISVSYIIVIYNIVAIVDINILGIYLFKKYMG